MSERLPGRHQALEECSFQVLRVALAGVQAGSFDQARALHLQARRALAVLVLQELVGLQLEPLFRIQSLGLQSGLGMGREH